MITTGMLVNISFPLVVTILCVCVCVARAPEIHSLSKSSLVFVQKSLFISFC